MEEEHIMLNILPVAAAGTTDGASMLPSILMLVVVIAVFYFLVMRPENKKKKAAAEMRNSLKVGDEITTIGGIVGTICAVKDKTIVLETGADRVRIEFTKWAISSKGTQSDENADPATDEKKDKKKSKKGDADK